MVIKESQIKAAGYPLFAKSAGAISYMNYPERGATIYQDLLYLVFFVCTNVFILAALAALVFVIMLRYGYKSVTIKFNKRNKLIKQIKNEQKIKEKSYISRLEKKINK